MGESIKDAIVRLQTPNFQPVPAPQTNPRPQQADRLRMAVRRHSPPHSVTTQQSLVPHTECLIQLKLVLGSSLEESSREVVHLELTMGEFNEFYREMEKINNMLSIIN